MDQIDPEPHKNESDNKGQNAPDTSTLNGKNIPKRERAQTSPADKTDESPTVRQYRILNRLTGALVFVGLVQLLVNYLLWNEAGKGSSAAVRADSLTQQSIRLAKQNYIEENRPYVFPGTPTVGLSQFGEMVVSLPITNYGHTPAYDVRWTVSYQRWKPVPDVSGDVVPKDAKPIVLAPRSTYTDEIPRSKFWSNDTSAWEFVVGKIWYRDNWDTTWHYTAFAYSRYHRFNGNFTIVYQSADADENTQKTNQATYYDPRLLN